MVDINDIDTQIENVDQLPVIYGLLQKMKIQATIDQVIQLHGNWACFIGKGLIEATI